ncbi:hypothetical protein [Niastella caeni]|nr:hypothetical protein [Niastella caeni]
MKRRLPWFQVGMMKNLYWFHTLFTIIYYIFQLFSRSDSQDYYLRPQTQYADWFSAYGTGTPFIDFVGYPFINYLGFSFEMMFVLFAYMGYWGFVFFYVYFKENLKYKHKFMGMDLIGLLIFLPNMHFWTVSLGKGSIIFWGLGMVMYGLSQLKTRKVHLLLGLLIIYHVRPHVFLFMAVGIVVGLFTGRQKVPLYQKLLVFGASIGAMVLLYDKIMAFSKIDGDNVMQSFNQFSAVRAYELSKAGSGIDISNYPLVLKLFTFWFRPLFVDAPGAMGLVVSVENMLYLALTAKLFQKGFIKFLRTGSALLKTSAVTFIATSFALSNTMSNMGIIIRQKSMIMYFLFFVILMFLDYKKHLQVMKRQRAMESREPEPPVKVKLAIAGKS